MANNNGPLWLELTLLSDATFGRGDGVAGLVDAEVQQDRYGLPYLSGRTLKGLMTGECAEVLFALEKVVPAQRERWRAAARFLFGEPGSDLESIARLRIGDAQLPADLREAVRQGFDSVSDDERGKLARANLESLTALRRQTALDAMGVPKEETLRTMRVILRETPFAARLDWLEPPTEDARRLLAATCSALRRVGTGRHRGRGLVATRLLDGSPWEAGSLEVAKPWLAEFEREVQGAGTHV